MDNSIIEVCLIPDNESTIIKAPEHDGPASTCFIKHELSRFERYIRYWSIADESSGNRAPEYGSTVQDFEKNVQYQLTVSDPLDIRQFIDMVDISCLERGCISQAELFVKELCNVKGEAYVIQMMNDIYTKHPNNELLMCTIINILSGIKYEKLGSFAITLCMGLLLTGSPLVHEYVINACDSWKSKDFLPCLKEIKTNSFLLKRLIDKVIRRIEQ